MNDMTNIPTSYDEIRKRVLVVEGGKIYGFTLLLIYKVFAVISSFYDDNENFFKDS